MIKVSSYHQVMPRPWYIITTAGLNTGWAIDNILREPHLPYSYSHDFEKFNKGWKVDEEERMQQDVDMHGGRIHIYSSVMNLAYP